MLGLKLNHVSKRGHWWPLVPTQQWPSPLLDDPQVKYWNAWLADISLQRYQLNMLNEKSKIPLGYAMSAVLLSVKFCKLLDKNANALAERHATCADNVICPSVLNLVLSYITPSRSTFLLTNALSSRKSICESIHIYCWITCVPFYCPRLTLISAWINNHNHLKCGMNILIHFHTTIVAQLKFGNG